MKGKIIPKFKILIDVSMLIIIILLMSYHLLPDSTHEWIGLSLFVLFILHNILNYKWYKNLFKGKYKALRMIQTITNFGLIIAMICCVISSILISEHVFSFIENNQASLGRSMHLSSTAWAFILMSFHLGLHGSKVINNVKKKFCKKTKTLKLLSYLFILITVILFVIGVYTFYSRKYWEELFILTEFKWFDYDKSLILYMFENLCVVMLFSTSAYYLQKFVILLNRYKKNN